MKGYNGRIGMVDLTGMKVDYGSFAERERELYIGGSSIGAYYLNKETGPETEPLGPDNLLMFLTGPFTATRVPSSGRHTVVARSPLTGIFGESNCGGRWGTALKEAGLDALFVRGRADKPVMLVVKDGLVEMRPAEHLWGLDTFAATEAVEKELGPGYEVATIGPAGEKLVLVAGIVTGGRHSRISGRTGMGAVMGSKNLKAVAVARRRADFPVHDDAGLKDSVKEAVPRMRERLDSFGKLGTAGGVFNYDKIGDWALKKWRQGRWPEGAARLTGSTMAETVLTGRTACWRCPIACGREVHIKEGKYATDGPVEGPEYETLSGLGGMLLIDDLDAVCYANQQCNRLGLDTISIGSIVAFATEAFEKGIITKDDTDGIELGWGRPDALIRMIEKIAKREGIGDILAQGERKAAEAIGKNSIEFCTAVKGLEMPYHDPRCFFGQAVSYSTSNRGACHLAGLTHPFELAVGIKELGYEEPHPRHQVEGKAEFVAKQQNLAGLCDALLICKFSLLLGALTPSHYLDWFRMITGLDWDMADFLRAGERAFNIKRVYNVRLGISRKDDMLPPRLLTLKRRGEGLEVAMPPVNVMLSDYYEYRGWSEEGVPTKEKLKELEIDITP